MARKADNPEVAMPTNEEWLRLYSSKNPEIRHRAATSILKRGTDAPLDLVIDILQTLSWQGLGAEAESVLLSHNDSELFSKMIGLLDSKDEFVREVACRVLGRSSNKAATPHLLRMLDDPKLMVRRAAGFGLADLQDESALPALRPVKERRSDDDENVLMAIDCAIQSLSEKSAGIPGIQDQHKMSFIDLYRSRVHERLSSWQDKAVDAEQITTSAEVLFLPSFHPEVLVSVVQADSGSFARIATLSESFWYHEQSARQLMGSVPFMPTMPPQLIAEEQHLSETDSLIFWEAIAAVDPTNLKSTSDLGIDGMSIRGTSCWKGKKNTFEAWQPKTGTSQWQFVQLFHDLVKKVMNSDEIGRRLNEVMGYLD